MKNKIWLAIPVALLAIQFIQPDIRNPPVVAAMDIQQVANPPADVKAVLKAACYDCHSNETRYPWYSRVAPVSWWVANHVDEGRSVLNFSEFDKPQRGADDITCITNCFHHTTRQRALMTVGGITAMFGGIVMRYAFGMHDVGQVHFQPVRLRTRASDEAETRDP